MSPEDKEAIARLSQIAAGLFFDSVYRSVVRDRRSAASLFRADLKIALDMIKDRAA